MADDVTATLRKALGKLNSQRAHLDRQISALEAAIGLLGRQSQNGPRSRRTMSAAARRAVGRRMKAYWAKRRQAAARAKTAK